MLRLRLQIPWIHLLCLDHCSVLRRCRQSLRNLRCLMLHSGLQIPWIHLLLTAHCFGLRRCRQSLREICIVPT